MSRKKESLRSRNRRSKKPLQGRSLRYETMEGRLVLSASGFAGNECAPEFNDGGLNAIVPSQPVSPGAEITFDFSPADGVSDGGTDGTAASDILITLDPDLGSRLTGATPEGATLTLDNDRWVFSWTPEPDQTGLFRLFMIATDDGGTGNVPLSDVFSFDIEIDNKPTVDLNGDNDSGIDFGPVSFTEADNSTPVEIVDSDLSIPFASNDMIASATVEIVNLQADGLESLAVTAGASLVVDSSTPGRLVISVDGGGLASKSVFETALRTLTYNNTSDSPEATRTINVTINDGTTDSETATTTVNITATNDKPELPVDPGQVDAQVGVEYTLPLVATDPDSGDLLTFKLVSGPDGAVISPLPAGGTDTTQQISANQNGDYLAEIRWTPTEAQGKSGPFTFTVLVTDSGGMTELEVYTVAIENQDPVANDDPTAGADPFAVDEDEGGTIVGNVLANDTDADGDTFSVNSVIVDGSAVANPNEFTTAKGALVTIEANGEVTYNPNGQFESLGAGESDTDTFQYTIIDAANNTSTAATVTITINGENDAPTVDNAERASFDVSEDAGAVTLDIAVLRAKVSDVDINDSHTIVSAPANPGTGGIFALDGGVLTFDPNGDYDVPTNMTEDVLFEVVLQDGSGEEITVEAKIVIQGLNDAPVAVNDPDYAVDEGATLTVSTRETGVLANDTDDTGNAGLVVFQVEGDEANVGQAIMVSDGSREGTLTVNSNGTFTFDPGTSFDNLADGQETEVTFTYIATDGAALNALSNVATVTITVTGVNDAPVANDVMAAAFEDDSPIDGDFSGSDVDEGEAATLIYDIVLASLPAEGTVTNNGDGTFSFDPKDDFQDLAEGAIRDVTFNYTATDGSATSGEGTVTVTVTGVNDAPVFDVAGLADALPTGSLRAGSDNVIDLDLDLSSTDANINSINMADLKLFTNDVEGDNVVYTSTIDLGTSFRNNNRPILDGQSRLIWVPTADDIDDGYVIRVAGQDTPTGGNGKVLNAFEIHINVITGNPQVESVSDIDVSLDLSEIGILFSEAMGASATATGNYTLETVDGSFPVGTSVSILTATQDGANGVTLALSDPTVDSLSTGGVTKLKLTLDAGIADLDDNTLEGPLEFEIDLTGTVAS